MGISKLLKRQKIKRRVRRNIFGTVSRPRLTVYRSNKEIYAQVIDDSKGMTLVSISSLNNKKLSKEDNNKCMISFMVGEELAAKAINLGIKNVVFDRNGFIYHGRIKAFADGARKGGLNF